MRHELYHVPVFGAEPNEYGVGQYAKTTTIEEFEQDTTWCEKRLFCTRQAVNRDHNEENHTRCEANMEKKWLQKTMRTTIKGRIWRLFAN